MKLLTSKWWASGSLGAVLALAVTAAQGQAAKVEQIVDVGETRAAEAKAAQERLDKIAEQTGDLLTQYKNLMKVVDGLKVYNTLLQRQLDAQQAEVDNLNGSIDEVAIIQRQITPLMLKMVEGLGQFVELDVPFLIKERQDRVQRLRETLESADVTTAEKFRSVLEAYQIENEYGRTIEAYKGTLDIDGTTREVDFLRIGRAALVYQSVGGQHNGVWNQAARKWDTLEGPEYRNQISKGLQIARKQTAPDILMVPVAAAGEGR